jgi:cell division protein FtsL
MKSFSNESIIEVLEVDVAKETGRYRFFTSRVPFLIGFVPIISVVLLPVFLRVVRQIMSGLDWATVILLITLLVCLFFVGKGFFNVFHLVHPEDVATVQHPKVFYEYTRLAFEQDEEFVADNNSEKVLAAVQAVYIQHLEKVSELNRAVNERKASYYLLAYRNLSLSLIPCLFLYVVSEFSQPVAIQTTWVGLAGQKTTSEKNIRNLVVVDSNLINAMATPSIKYYSEKNPEVKVTREQIKGKEVKPLIIREGETKPRQAK